jgi:hypothetical protein
VTLGGSIPWIVAAAALLAGAGAAFWALGVRERATTARRTTVAGQAAAAG